MAGMTSKNFDSPDETRTPDKTKVDVLDLGGAKVARMNLQPGWKWSECIKPVVGTDSCQVLHVGMVESGTLHIVHNDGDEADIGPGNAYRITPGHEAWVVGNEPFVAYEFESTAAETYAKGS